MTEERLLTTQHIDDGFVDVEAEQLDGTKQTLRLKFPSWRKRRELILQFQRELDGFLFVRECLAHSHGATKVDFLLDRLTPDAVARLEAYAVAIVCGESYQKKMMEIGQQALAAMSTANGSTPSEPSLGTDIQPETCASGVPKS